MADKRKHSRFGGSAAKRFFACPGSVALCDQIPELPPTAEALEGTAAHNLAEYCLRYDFAPEELVGRFFDKFEVTPEMADAVRAFVDDVRADKKRGAEITIEHTVSLSAFDPEMWGTVDALSYFPDTRLLRVRDYKHGAGVFVPVESNHQLMYYGLGALLATDKPVERVELCVYQPNHYGDGEPARSWEVGVDELFDFGGQLVEAINAARQPDAPLNPGKHCQFCTARGICPALKKIVAAFERLVPEPPKAMSADELGRALTMAPLIYTRLNGVKQLAYAETLRGNVPTGFKPVAKRTHRRWRDAELVAGQAPRTFLGELTEDDMYTRRVITPAAFERLVGKAGAAEFISAYAEKPEGLTLVPVSDKRPAVPVGPLAEFEPIGDLENVEG